MQEQRFLLFFSENAKSGRKPSRNAKPNIATDVTGSLA
jgi:hypothetical protein